MARQPTKSAQADLGSSSAQADLGSSLEPTPVDAPEYRHPGVDPTTSMPVASTTELSTAPTLRYTPCTIRLDQIDAQTLRHVYCHRDGDSLKWDDESRPDNLRSLGESLLSEGQLVPVEFYRQVGTDADGNQVTRNILVRGYRLVEATRQIIARALDPDKFHPTMELRAVEIAGGGEADYLVRAVASNEVRAALSPDAQYRVAAMLLDRGVSATRGARALGISLTQFGRYVNRYHNPWMQEHVRTKHIEQSYADDLLDAAGRTGQIPKLQTQMDSLVEVATAHINEQQTLAKATKQKFDEEKQGQVSAYIKKKLVGAWHKALEKGEDYTPRLELEEKSADKWTFICEVNPKDGKLKIAGLNGLVLAQKTYQDLGLIAAGLHSVATQVKEICDAARAKHDRTGTNGSAAKATIKFYRDNGWHDLADQLETKLKAETGKDDPQYGTVPPRTEVSVGGRIMVGEPGYDPAQDGGPGDT